MCCDGSLFGLVGLARGEAEHARRRRLRVVPSGKGFEQPCAALETSGSGADERKTCSIYDERPHACRAFACRLYERHSREGGPIEERLAAVRRVRELVASLEELGLGPAHFEGYGARVEALGAREMYAELMRRLERDFTRA